MPGRAFTITLGLIALITPLAVHLFFPVIPAVKVALGLGRLAQLTFSIALFGMAFATLFYGSLSDRYGRRPVLCRAGAFCSAAPFPPIARDTRMRWCWDGSFRRSAPAAPDTRPRHRARHVSRRATGQVIAYLTMFGTLGP